MSARLAASVVVSALLRTAQAAGGFGTVLAKGDATAGAIVIVVAERGLANRVMERILQPDGHYGWREVMKAHDESLEGAVNHAELEKFLARKRKVDPDLWLIELDVPSGERFAAEMSAFD